MQNLPLRLGSKSITPTLSYLSGCKASLAALTACSSRGPTLPELLKQTPSLTHWIYRSFPLGYRGLVALETEPCTPRDTDNI